MNSLKFNKDYKISNTSCLCQNDLDKQLRPGLDPGYLERGFKFTKGVGLLILPVCWIFFYNFSENSP